MNPNSNPIDQIRRLENENKILRDKLNRFQKYKDRKKKIKWWLFQKTSTPIFGKRLKKSITNAIKEYKAYKTVSVDTVSDLSSSVIWRVTRIGFFAITFAILPSMVLIFQTKLLMNQNKLVQNQNALTEAQRRSSLVFVMDNVLSDLNEELKYKSPNSEKQLSKTLEARIVSLSRAMQPYAIQDIDPQSDLEPDQKASPERGQLLYSLVKSDLSKKSLTDIFNTGDFKYSFLREAFLENVYLRYSKLDYSDFSHARMPKVDLGYSDLQESNFYKSNLSEAKLVGASLIRSNLEKAELQTSDFTKANLTAANLSEADLSEAKLWGTKLDKANLEHTILDRVIVHRSDWIAYVQDSLELKGADAIASNYRIKKQGKQQFMLVRKKK